MDLDNASAVALAMQIFDIPFTNINFVDANWDNPDNLKDIFIIDMFSGLKGETKIDRKGDTIVLSAFASILDKYGCKHRKKAYDALALFIDAQDSTGDWRTAYPEVSFSQSATRMPTILTAFFALKNYRAGSDALLLGDWYDIIEGIYTGYNEYQLAKKEAEKGEWYEDYPIVIIRNQRYPQTTKALFAKGAKVIVYTRDYNIGAVRSNTCDVNLGNGLKEFVPDWFHHSAGFLSCWGSWKAPKAKDSGVEPEMLAEWVSGLL